MASPIQSRTLTHPVHHSPCTLIVSGRLCNHTQSPVSVCDVAAFADCASRSNVPLAPACADKDLDGDADGDLADFGTLQRCVFGPGNPANPECVR